MPLSLKGNSGLSSIPINDFALRNSGTTFSKAHIVEKHFNNEVLFLLDKFVVSKI
jgi:hypothetical protein